MLDPELQLVAGTPGSSRAGARPARGHALRRRGRAVRARRRDSVGTAARNLVLLGDPNQLPQVSQGSHPPGAEASVLGHLLGDDETVPPTGGFPRATWRLRPEVNAYVSGTFTRAGSSRRRSHRRGRSPRETGCGSSPSPTGDIRPHRKRLRRFAPRSSGLSGRGTSRTETSGRSPMTTSSSSRPTTRTSRAAQALPDRCGSERWTSSRASRPRCRSSRWRARRADVPRGRLPLLPQPPERCGLAGKCLAYVVATPASGDELPDGGADAAGERPVSVRRGRGGAGWRERPRLRSCCASPRGCRCRWMTEKWLHQSARSSAARRCVFLPRAGGSLDLAGYRLPGCWLCSSTRAPAAPASTLLRAGDEFPGARGCTPQKGGFRDLRTEFDVARVPGRRAFVPDR